MSRKRILGLAVVVLLAGFVAGCPSTPPQTFQFILINVGTEDIIKATVQTLDGSNPVDVLPVAALQAWEYVVIAQTYTAANTYGLAVEFDYDQDGDGQNETAVLSPPGGQVDPSSLTENFITWNAYFKPQQGGGWSRGIGYNYGDQISTYTSPVPTDVTP